LFMDKTPLSCGCDGDHGARAHAQPDGHQAAELAQRKNEQYESHGHHTREKTQKTREPEILTVNS